MLLMQSISGWPSITLLVVFVLFNAYWMLYKGIKIDYAFATEGFTSPPHVRKVFLRAIICN
jgi:hypothetical protein